MPFQACGDVANLSMRALLEIDEPNESIGPADAPASIDQLINFDLSGVVASGSATRPSQRSPHPAARLTRR